MLNETKHIRFEWRTKFGERVLAPGCAALCVIWAITLIPAHPIIAFTTLWFGFWMAQPNERD